MSPKKNNIVGIKANQHVRVFIDAQKEVSIVMRWKDFNTMCEFFHRTMLAVEMVDDSVPLTRPPILERVLKRKLAEILIDPFIGKDIPRGGLRRR